MEDAHYRKINDGSRSAREKKHDMTPVRGILNGELVKEVKSGELLTELEERESQGPYTCRSCTSGTWNDSDMCDQCEEEAIRALED